MTKTTKTTSNTFCWLAILGFAVSQATAAEEPTVAYDAQIRPILANKCYQCHGPDAQKRKSGLRLDLRDPATSPAESGAIAIVPGKPEDSALIVRTESAEDSLRMPPPSSKKSLTNDERQLLKKWIQQGAQFSTHWSFVAPRQVSIPTVRSPIWARGPIDRFIQNRHETVGVSPSPEGDRVTLIRRLTLDLTGLPPTIAEVDAFMSDTSPAAYDRLLDRLLASPHFGERLALEWLDASRYADTHGYHIDSGRDMTRWREWVIQAFNQNMPFDQFTLEQLAGDLLPYSTLDQRIASGFNRNHMINFEGGAIPDEYHTAYIVDRVNTTGAVWLGLTIGCAQCHDHKYDPISQRDFYQLFAYFHNVSEKGLDGSKGNASPMIKAPTPLEAQLLDVLATSERDLQHRLQQPDADLDRSQSLWEQEAKQAVETNWSTNPDTILTADGGVTFEKLSDHSFQTQGSPPEKATYTAEISLGSPSISGVKLEALADERLEHKGPGRSTNGNFVLTDVRISIWRNDQPVALPIKSATADFSQQKFPAEHAIDGNLETGWGIHPQVGKPHHLILSLTEPVVIDSPTKLRVELAFRSPFGQHQISRLRISTTSAKYPAGLPLPDNIRHTVLAAADSRTEKQVAELRNYYRSTQTPFATELERLSQSRHQLEQQVRTVMVMEELAQPRETFVLVRGQYDKKGEKVSPGTFAALPQVDRQLPPTRLGLAQWLTDPSHPLTSRVNVNRFWQMLFGTGLVKTSEDFGTQGELPSHPELLDWLAVEFRVGPLAHGTNTLASGPHESTNPRESNSPMSATAAHLSWNIKLLIRSLAGSSTYRQSSKSSAEQSTRDPENRLLARGPRFRLPAEFIRDQALSISGLLDQRIGGKSVFPYQPTGLWEELMSREDGANWTAQKYVQDQGLNLYRRSLYTFWKRTSPPPTMSTFDAPDREVCSVRRAITNTPLQSLILMNDPTYVESARLFAESIVLHGGQDDLAKLHFAFRTITSRVPAPREIQVLMRTLDAHRNLYRQNADLVRKLLSVGEYPRNTQLNEVEVAAWCMVASALFNLDETITKG